MNDDARLQARPDPITRFFGGSPLWVLVRLALLSLVVGVVLVALDLTPLALLDATVRFVERLFNLGWDTFGRLGRYFAAGAMVVLPIWLVLRLLDMTRGR